MQYRHLGKSNLQVSALCLGTMMFGDQTGREEAKAIVGRRPLARRQLHRHRRCVRHGRLRNHGGRAAQGTAPRLGAGHQARQQDVRTGERRALLAQLDAAGSDGGLAARLQTDYVDILYLHRDYNGMDLEEPLRALDALLRAGKIRYWGVSNFAAGASPR